MLKILKYLKQSTLAIIAVIVLLVIQAACDLSLPQYTSDIVNVGIQQGGIDNVAPTVIRESQMDKLFIFIHEEEKETILDHYSLLSKDTLTEKEYNANTKKYPLLESETIYHLDTKDENTINDLNRIMSKAMLFVSMFEGDSEEAIQMREEFKSHLSPEMADLDIFEILKAMPKEQLNKILEQSESKFSAMPESIVEQSAISLVKAEYKAIGMNTDKMQSNYILIAGVKMLSLALLSLIATVLVGFFSARVAALLGKNLRGRVFEKVLSFSNNEFDKFSTASLITRSTNDIQQVGMAMVLILKIAFMRQLLESEESSKY